MAPGTFRVAVTDRDKNLFTRIFENRVMSFKQIRDQVFPASSQQAISRRLIKLSKFGYLDRRVVQDGRGKDSSAYLITPKSLRDVKQRYSRQITSDLWKSDSVQHDIKLVDLRSRIEAMECVSGYYTENMLQACAELSEIDRIEPFVQNYTDAVVEFAKGGKKLIAGLEFENSEKTVDRYSRKLLNYYSDPRVPFVFYVCTSPAIRKMVARAESGIVGNDRPRCFFGLYENVLSSPGDCTFVNENGDKIVLR